MRIVVHSKSGTADWNGTVIEVSRVPCLEEFVVLPPVGPRKIAYGPMEVTYVSHYMNPESGTVAGIDLDDEVYLNLVD